LSEFDQVLDKAFDKGLQLVPPSRALTSGADPEAVAVPENFFYFFFIFFGKKSFSTGVIYIEGAGAQLRLALEAGGGARKLFLLFFIFFGKKSFSTGVIYIEGAIGLAGLLPAVRRTRQPPGPRQHTKCAQRRTLECRDRSDWPRAG